jgi:hypothetical protein
MRTTVKILTTTLAAGTLCGLSVLTAASSFADSATSGIPESAPADLVIDGAAADAAGQPGAHEASDWIIAKHFMITNLSHYDMTLTSINGQWGGDELMPIGTVLHPGQQHPFGVTFHLFGPWNYRNAVFAVTDPATGQHIGTYTAQMKDDRTGSEPQLSKANYSGAGGLTTSADGMTLNLYDAKGTVIDLPAGQGQRNWKR